MWGVRAIRVGLLLCGSLATIAGSGCCDCCQRLWKGEKTVPASQSNTSALRDDKDAEKVLSEWKRSPADWGFKDQPSHLTPEQIKGGIY